MVTCCGSGDARFWFADFGNIGVEPVPEAREDTREEIRSVLYAGEVQKAVELLNELNPEVGGTLPQRSLFLC